MLIKFRSHGAFCPHPLRPTFPARPAVRVHAKPDTQEGPSAPVIAPTFTALEPIHLLDELLRGHVLAKAKASFPAVPWGAAQIAQVLAGGTMALLAAALVTTPGISPSFSTSVQGLAQVIGSEEQQVAVMHVGRELLLLSATGSLLAATLHSSSPRSKGLFSFQMRRPWLAATCAVCAVAFPLADPVLTNVTAQALTLLLGSDAAASPAGGQLADSIRACVAANDLGSLSLHVLAGGLLGPLWEETFWRGFILTSMTRVLPLQFCVALSSTWFALLHLTPSSALPIWLLAACSDVLYLRSASLAPPLMLHALWNTSQILAVAYLGKEAFV